MLAIEKLKDMTNKPYLFNKEEVVILGYCDGTGDDGTDVEIYLNNGKTIIYQMCDLLIKLEMFKPITKNVIVLANQRLNKVSTINPTIIEEMRDITLNTIREIKTGKTDINQVKQIFQGINTLTNLAKTELDYRKYLDSQDLQ